MNWLLYFLKRTIDVMSQSWGAAMDKRIFSPAGWFGTLLFASVGNALIYLPAIFSFMTPFTVGYFIPGILIISLFGLLLTGFFRWVVGESLTFITYHQDVFQFTVFGFKSTKVERIPISEVVGLALIDAMVMDISNFKVCLVLKDGRLILLYTEKLEAFAEGVMQRAKKLTGLKLLKDITGTPDNDIQKGHSTI